MRLFKIEQFLEHFVGRICICIGAVGVRIDDAVFLAKHTEGILAHIVITILADLRNMKNG